MRIRYARPEELAAVARFHLETRYAGGLDAADRVVLLERGCQIAGSYRLSREHGLLVLRGMRVAPEIRGHGLGRLLLCALAAINEPCACIPHAPLEPFHARAGSRALPPGSGPGFLEERAATYRQRGLVVLVMLRDPRSLRGAAGAGYRVHHERCTRSDDAACTRARAAGATPASPEGLARPLRRIPAWLGSRSSNPAARRRAEERANGSCA